MLVLWSPAITGSDSSMYMETARNVVEGKGFVCSVSRFNMDIETLSNYVNTYGNRYQGMSRAPVYVYAMSFIYLLSGKEHFMLGVNLLNLILFISSLLLIYKYMLKKFPEQHIAHLAAILWIGGSFTLFEYSFGAWLESFTLFNFVIVFLLHMHLLKRDQNPVWQYLLYALAVASLFTIKRSNMPIAAAFILHFIFQKNYRRFIMVSLFFGIFITLWYGLRYYVMQIPPLYPFSHSFPYSGYSHTVSAIPRVLFSAKQIADVSAKFLQISLNLKNLGLLFPFVLLYLAGNPNDKEKQIIWLLLFTNYGIYALSRGNPNPRYIFPIFVPLIINGASYLDKTIRKLFPNKAIIPTYVILMFTFFFQVKEIANFIQWVPVAGNVRNEVFAAADDVLDANNVPDEAIVLCNIHGYNVYTKRGYILTPPNTTIENKQQILDLYDVDYVLHYLGLTHYLGWNEYTVKVDQFYDLPQAEIVSSNPWVRLYKVPKE